MKLNHYIAATAILAAFVVQNTAAQQADEHKDHHPAVATANTPKSAPVTNTSSVTPSMLGVEMAGMDLQMKRMQEMHDKMMSAKTPNERNALMGEHMKVMQDGMNMMNKMSSKGMGGMKKKVGMPANAKDTMKDGMAEHHQMMEKRMEMMQSMMQMMMDRMSNSSSK